MKKPQRDGEAELLRLGMRGAASLGFSAPTAEDVCGMAPEMRDKYVVISVLVLKDGSDKYLFEALDRAWQRAKPDA